VKFRVLAAADAEAISAALWYEDRQPGLADRFLSEVQSAFQSIRSAPLSMARLEYYCGTHEIRRYLMNSFPYAVIFLCRPEETVVVAVAHTRRRPLYWLNRLN
jgi:hypothetical protein